MMRTASVASRVPQAPKVSVPRHRQLTWTPVRPSRRYSGEVIAGLRAPPRGRYHQAQVGAGTRRRMRHDGRRAHRRRGHHQPATSAPRRDAVLCCGNRPCQTFMRCSPFGSSSSPQGNGCCTGPPRAAYSHLRLGGQPLACTRRTSGRPPRDIYHRMIDTRTHSRTAGRMDDASSRLHLAPPRRGGDAARRREIVRKQATEHE
jgi:hypothetical protein